jgi:hypothetical protein
MADSAFNPTGSASKPAALHSCRAITTIIPENSYKNFFVRLFLKKQDMQKPGTILALPLAGE